MVLMCRAKQYLMGLSLLTQAVRLESRSGKLAGSHSAPHLPQFLPL